MKKLLFWGWFIGISCLFLFGVGKVIAAELGDCVCGGGETLDETGIAVDITAAACQQKEITENPYLTDADPSNDTQYSCVWNKRQQGLCACTWSEKEGVGTAQKTISKSETSIKSRGECILLKTKEQVLSALPGSQKSTYDCQWTAKKTGCYCDVRMESNVSAELKAEFRPKVGEVDCQPGEEVTPVGKDVYSNCFYIDNTTASEGEPGSGSTESGAANINGSGLGPVFNNNTQGLAVYTGVGFVNNGTVVELQNPLPTTKIPELIGRIIKTALGVMGSFAFLAFVYGGFMWLIAGGNDERVKKGKDSMVWATIGIFVIFSAYGLMSLFFNTIGAWQGDITTGGSPRSDSATREAGCYCRKMTGGTREKMQIERANCVPNKVIDYSDSTKLFKTVEDCVWMEAGSTENTPPPIGNSGSTNTTGGSGTAVGTTSGGSTLDPKCKSLTKEDDSCCKSGQDCCAGLGAGYSCVDIKATGQTCTEKYSNLCLSQPKNNNYVCVKQDSCKKKTTTATVGCKAKSGKSLSEFCEPVSKAECTKYSAVCVVSSTNKCVAKSGVSLVDYCKRFDKPACEGAGTANWCEWK